MAHWRSGQSGDRHQGSHPKSLNCEVPSPLLGKHETELLRKTDKSRFTASPVLLLAQGGKQETCSWWKKGNSTPYGPSYTTFFSIVEATAPVMQPPSHTSEDARKTQVELLYCCILTRSLLSRGALEQCKKQKSFITCRVKWILSLGKVNDHLNLVDKEGAWGSSPKPKLQAKIFMYLKQNGLHKN